MKLFGKARLKLTVTYTAVLMVISIAFSIVIGVTASNEIGRPLDHAPGGLIVMEDDYYKGVFQDRVSSAQSRMIVALVLVNAAVLLVGSVGSYFLALWTLKPIEKAMDDQARFVSGASHELRTPLAAIAMENEVLLRGKTPPAKDLKDQIKSNLDEVGKLRDLTNYLLELSKDETLTLVPTDLGNAATKAIDLNKKLAASKKIIIDNQVKSGEVVTNPDALVEIMSIVINNAIKYSPTKATVHLAYQDERILIMDHGKGIAEKDLPHIFDRFYRAEESRTSDGYGLGLSLAKHLAERSGANIEASNNSDGGATFAIRFQ